MAEGPFTYIKIYADEPTIYVNGCTDDGEVTLREYQNNDWNQWQASIFAEKLCRRDNCEYGFNT